MKTSFFNKLVVTFLLTASLLNISYTSLFSMHPTIHGRAMIRPSLVYMQPAEKQRFKVAMLATRLMAARTPDKVKWLVNNVPCGNKNIGTIDAEGIYQAPAIMPPSREIHIHAYVKEAANKHLFATVIIGNGPPVYKSKKIWAEKTDDPNAKLKSPHGIGLDKDGNILIADQGVSRVFRYSANGKFLDEIGKGPGSEEGFFKEPREVTSDSEGNIFVSDSKGDRPRIQVFSHEGEFLRIFAVKGRGPGQILRSHGIDFDFEQRLFNTDVDNMRVNVYDKTGKFLYDFGDGLAYENMNPGELNAPHGIFVDPSGDVFVNSYYGPTQKFSANGYVLFAFAHGDPPDGPVYFHSLTGDQWGNVYLLVRSMGGYQGALQNDQGKKISMIKYNNNGDFITSLSFSNPEHSETEAVVDENGLVYALFVGEKEKGVEIFIEQ